MESDAEISNFDERIRRQQTEERARIEIVVEIVSKVMTRYKDIQDPVMRHTLFIDKFCCLLEVLTGYFESDVTLRKNLGASPEFIAKCRKLSLEVQQEMNSLLLWIQNPHREPERKIIEKNLHDAPRDSIKP